MEAIEIKPKSITLSQQDLGRAIIEYLSFRDGLSPMYEIVGSTLEGVPAQIDFDLSDAPFIIDQLRPYLSKKANTITLSQEDVCKAISLYIDKGHYKGNRIREITNFDFPDSFEIVLGVPHGSKFLKEFQHQF